MSGKLRLQAGSPIHRLYSRHGNRLTPRGKCIAWANSRRSQKQGKLIHSSWDSDLRERWPDEGASGSMLGVWTDSSFLTPEQTGPASRGEVDREGRMK
ncbi:MAG TPA: hypothetical protein VGI46_17135, partial [Candidatus Acidoferrum sp.]